MPLFGLVVLAMLLGSGTKIFGFTSRVDNVIRSDEGLMSEVPCVLNPSMVANFTLSTQFFYRLILFIGSRALVATCEDTNINLLLANLKSKLK